MPHVVFNERINLENFSNQFSTIIQKEPFLVKLVDVFLDKEKRTALIPAVTIDKIHQQFLIEISTRKEKTTIRLYPATDPEKTIGVKTALGLVANHLLDMFPTIHLARTNIAYYLPERK